MSDSALSNKLKFIKYCFNKYKLLDILNNENKDYNLNIFLELSDEIYSLYINYLSANILQLIYNDIYDNIFYEIYELVYVKYIESDILSNILMMNTKSCNKLLYICNKIMQLYVFKYIVPKRSYKKSYIRKTNNKISYNIINSNL